MYKKITLAFLSFVMICAMMLNLSGCDTTAQATNLMKDVTPNEIIPLVEDDQSIQNCATTDFAVRLLQESFEKDKNTLISPLSVLSALAMTANGAHEETLRQMESVFGMNAKALSLYLYCYVQDLPQGEGYKLNLANSIWVNDDHHFTANQDFLQTNADFYGADIFKAPFNDQTCREINNWINEKTDGMIEEVLDQIPDMALMYLVNALAFDAEWEDIYDAHQVRDGVFAREDGLKQDAEFMFSMEHSYLEDDKAIGFKKYYKNSTYAFVAMLPKEGVSVSEYVASLSGESMNAMLANPVDTMVYTSIPKFEVEYSTEMSKILKSMGMTDAFNKDNADFEGLGTFTDGNIYLSRVLHKAYINVGEKGTRAAAVTVIEAPGDGCYIDKMPKEVYLDRPFVYMLIDCENNVPFFIGTMMDIQG